MSLLIQLRGVATARHSVSPRHILSLLPGLVAYFGTDLRYLYANDAYRRWRDMSPEAILGLHVRDVVGERNFPLIVDNLRRALAGEHVTYEYHIFDGNHQRRVQGSYVPDVNTRGEVMGIVTLVTDISRRDDLQLQIAHNEAMFNEAFENTSFGKAMVGVDGCVIRSNRALADMLGHSLDEMEGLSFAELTHPEDISADLMLFRSVLNNERDSYRIEKRYVRVDGSLVHAKIAVSAIRDDRGEVIRFFAHVEDVTQQREAERRLIETNARLSLVSEAIRGGSWHMNIATGEFETSEALARFVAGPAATPLDLAGYQANIHHDDLAAADLRPLIEGECDRSSVEYRLHTHRGTHWMRCDRRLLRDAQGKPEQIIGVATDLTEEHQRRIRAERQASTDPLTGLLNRRGLHQHLAVLREDHPCGLLLIDLDGFKQVNDALGHDAGDAILVEAAARLRSCALSDDIVARLGGDEFAIVLVNAEPAALIELAERVTSVLQSPFDACTGTHLIVGASLGAAWAPNPPIEGSGMFSRADTAMYKAKAAGKGTWRLAS